MMSMANDRMTRCSSALLRSYQRNIDAYIEDPMSEYAPRECFDVVVCKWDEEVDIILSFWGFDSGDEFMREFKKRTSERCAYEFSFMITGR